MEFAGADDRIVKVESSGPTPTLLKDIVSSSVPEGSEIVATTEEGQDFQIVSEDAPPDSSTNSMDENFETILRTDPNVFMMTNLTYFKGRMDLMGPEAKGKLAILSFKLGRADLFKYMVEEGHVNPHMFAPTVLDETTDEIAEFIRSWYPKFSRNSGQRYISKRSDIIQLFGMVQLENDTTFDEFVMGMQQFCNSLKCNPTAIVGFVATPVVTPTEATLVSEETSETAAVEKDLKNSVVHKEIVDETDYNDIVALAVERNVKIVLIHVYGKYAPDENEETDEPFNPKKDLYNPIPLTSTPDPSTTTTTTTTTTPSPEKKKKNIQKRNGSWVRRMNARGGNISSRPPRKINNSSEPKKDSEEEEEQEQEEEQEEQEKEVDAPTNIPSPSRT